METKTDNLTAVLHGINDLRLEQRPIPVPNDDQVLLQMEVVGICGSDVYYYVQGRIGHFVVTAPMVIGHEASGTVVKVGKNVKHLQPGDQVAIEPGVPCRKCDFCKSGDYNLCADVIFCATPPYDGNLARYYVHPADFCHKLPPNMDLEDGALIEPLSVGVHATKIGNVKVGDVVLIFGAGPIGLVTLLAAKANGASKIIILDILEIRLQKAKEIGAHHTIKVTKTQSDDEIVELIKKLLGGEPNKCFECCGTEQSLRVALKVTKTKGIIVLIGTYALEQNLPVPIIVFRQLHIRGSFRYCNDYKTAIEMVSTGKINTKPLITHHFTMEETVKAFETAKTQEGNPIKILIHANPNWNPSKKSCNKSCV